MRLDDECGGGTLGAQVSGFAQVTFTFVLLATIRKQQALNAILQID